MKSIVLLFAVAFLVGLGYSIGVNHAFATEITYEPNGVVIRSIPTVCSIEPIDSDLTKNQIEKFSTQTKSSLEEWEQHLKQKAGKNNWSNWEINYKNINYEKLDYDSLLDCDIVVVFSSTPPSLDFWGILGLAMSDYETGKTLIEIYYSIPEWCDSGERKREGDIIYIINIPCYGEMMVSGQLGGVIRHELGHGFGLGHYQSADENETLEWNKGLSPTPSIMVQTSYENSDELRIAPKDIDMLFDIYGEDGFILNSEEEKNLTLEDPHQIDQKYADFKSDEYGFSIQYPQKWGFDDVVETFDDFTLVLSIEDEEESLNRTFEVGFYDKSWLTGTTETKILEELFENEKRYCGDFLAEDFGFDCSNLVLLESKTQKGKVYTIKSLWNDGTHHHIIHRNFVVSVDKVWEISGYGPLAPFVITSNVMEHTINSFNINNSQTPTNISQIPEEKSQNDPHSQELDVGPPVETQIPDWIRGNAQWWAQGAIGDSDFVSGIQYLIKEGIMQIPATQKAEIVNDSQGIPSWIKNNADWWAQGLISDGDFVKGIQYLVEQGIIQV